MKQNYSLTQILREINFRDCRNLKFAILTVLELLDSLKLISRKISEEQKNPEISIVCKVEFREILICSQKRRFCGEFLCEIVE